MRTLLGTLLALVLLLAGCGEDGQADQVEDSPAPQDAQLLTLVSQSDVGGEVAPEAVPVEELEQSFTDDRITTAIDEALDTAELREGTVAAGAVVAIGCETPDESDIVVDTEGGQVQVSSRTLKSDKQCLVPITTVALVAVDEDLL